MFMSSVSPKRASLIRDALLKLSNKHRRLLILHELLSSSELTPHNTEELLALLQHV